jgi:hypothetical protein
MSAPHPPWCVHPALPPSGNKRQKHSALLLWMEAAGYPITAIPIKLLSVISKKTIIFEIQVGITHAFIIHIFSYLLFYFCHEIHHYPTQKLPCMAIELCAQCPWLVPPFWLSRHILLLLHVQCMFSKFTHFQCLWWLPVTRSPDIVSHLYFQNAVI